MSLINYNVLPFYESENLLNKNKRESTNYNLLVDNKTLLPFQIIRPLGAFDVTKVEIEIDGITTDITTEMLAAGLTTEIYGDFRVILFDGKSFVDDFAIGTGQLIITDSAGVVYSESFLTKNTDLERCTKIEYFNNDNISLDGGETIVFDNDFRFICILDTTISNPIYDTGVDTSERAGSEFPNFSYLKKTYQFDIQAPEYLVDALRHIRLFTNCRIFSDYETFLVDDFQTEVENTEKARVYNLNAKFTQNNIVKSTISEKDIIEIYELADSVVFSEELSSDPNYTSFSRYAINNITGHIINTFLTTTGDGVVTDKINLRISKDGGRTFANLEGLTYTEVYVEESITQVAPLFTEDGRLFVFFSDPSNDGDAFYFYSDDEGATRSDNVIFPKPAITLPNKAASIVASNFVVKDGSTVLIFSQKDDTNASSSAICLAELQADGFSFDTDFSIVIQNTLSTKPVLRDADLTISEGGDLIAIIRTGLVVNNSGINLPIMAYSSTFSNWNGSGGALSIADIETNINYSGYSELMGAGENMGFIFRDRISTHSLDIIKINGIEWVVIFSWLREWGTSFYYTTSPRITVIKLSDYLSSGVSSIKGELNEELFTSVTSGDGAFAGGYGNFIKYGNDLLLTVTNETFRDYSNSNFKTAIYKKPIKESFLREIIVNYNLS